MARHRIIILLALTSVVVMMITISRFSTIDQQTPVRFISYQNPYEYQQNLRLKVIQHNSYKSLNNLFENIIKPKNHLKSVDSNLIGVEKANSQKLVVLSSISPQQEKDMNLIQSDKLDDQQDYLMPMVSNNENQDNYNVTNVVVVESKPISIPNVIKDQTTDSKRPVTTGTSKIFATSEVKNSETNLNQNLNIFAKNIINESNIDLVVDQKSVRNNQKLQKLDDLENNDNQLTKIKLKSKLVFDSEDLKSTKSMKIDKPLVCGDDMGAALDLFVIVNSAVNHWQERRAVRDTWGRFAIERGSPLLFLIGSSTDPLVQKKVEEEDSEYGDLLQGHFIDNYFNLTLKTISMMKWLSEKCSKAKYVLKVDDDMFVNMQHIIDFTETRYYNKCIIGKLAKKWKPHRNTNNKWYVPVEAFNGTIFPSFATGPAYMMSGDATQPLYEWSIKLKPIYLEDVYMTGIVAERAHIRRLNHAMITNVHIKDINSCNFSKFMTSHKHSPQEIRKLWDLVYSQSSKPCPTPKPNKTTNKSVQKSVTPPKSKPVLNSG